MKVLITGAGGFVGRHLAAELHGAGHELVLVDTAADYSKSEIPIAVETCDIRDSHRLKQIFNRERPDAVVHLAAISHIIEAENSLEQLSEVNIVGTHNICAAAASIPKPVKFLFVSSAFVYRAGTGDQDPLSENSPLSPETAYGKSKLAGEYIVRTFESELFKPYIVRPFNHIGPGQSPKFVCPGLAKRIAEAPQQGTVSVGNLESWRDFTDVRDVCRAYRLILEKQPSESLFAIGSGKTVQIKEIFEKLVHLSGKQLNTALDQSLLRKKDPRHFYADPSLANSVLGWHAKIPLENTLKEMLDEASRD